MASSSKIRHRSLPLRYPGQSTPMRDERELKGIGSFNHNDPEFESLRKDFIAFPLELSRSDIY